MFGRAHNIAVLLAAVVLLLAATALGFMLGSSSVSLPELAAWATGGEVTDAARAILANVRLPRVLAALLAGAALAASGAIIQAALDNPLASPNVVGVNSGAGLFVLLAAALVPGVLWLAPPAALPGGPVTAPLIFGLSPRGGPSPAPLGRPRKPQRGTPPKEAPQKDTLKFYRKKKKDAAPPHF